MESNVNRLFEEKSILKAVISLAVPTICAQLITVVYNIADTYFIGQLGDPAQVAAVHVCMTGFGFLTGIANLFGIGGASLISRSLGIGEREKARRTSAFCVWGAVLAALIYAVLFTIFRPVLLPIMGANDEIYIHAYRYLFWTVTLGSIPTVLSAVLAHLVRAEGASAQAGFGIALGGVLNIILDPIFVFAFSLGLTGAAAATMLSNCIVVIYFAVFIFRNRDNLLFSAESDRGLPDREIVREVLLVGTPSFIMMTMSLTSNIMITRFLRNYSTYAIAGIGVAKKIDMVAFSVQQGLTQGVLPLLGYTYAAKQEKRFKEAIRTTFCIGMGIALILLTILYGLAPQITRCFIDDAETVSLGGRFLRVICLICPTTCINFLVITIFQAVGKKRQAFVLSLLRKGIVDIPLMIILQPFFGVMGVVWAIPLADWIDAVMSLILGAEFRKKNMK